MRALSSTLLAAQKTADRVPYVKVVASTAPGGVFKLNWTRFYTGAESETSHGLTIPSDGSLIRVRIGPSGDGSEVYRQRVANPGPLSDFSQWAHSGQFHSTSVAVASGGSEVSLLWQDWTGSIYRIQSNNCGATWSEPEGLESSGDASCGLAAAYKPNGDLCVFFTSGDRLRALRRTGGVWQDGVWLDQDTGPLYSVGAVYDGDWNLVFAGKDAAGNYKVWSVVFGDGGLVAAGSWSTLREIATAPAGGDFEYRGVFMDKPDVSRAFYVEKFGGTQAYSQVFRTNTVDGADYTAGLWLEPVPFNHTCECGMALAHHGGYCWLSTPDGVWRASGSDVQLDISADVVAARCECGRWDGRLTVELGNADGSYNSPGSGGLAALDTGCGISFSPGYVTAAGNEASDGQSFWLESLEHVSTPGRAALLLHAVSGWDLLGTWRARHQFRWNKDTPQVNVKQIIEFLLARVGLKLAVISQSAVATGFYPDMTIHPGDSGTAVMERLLSLVPDCIFMEGDTACLLDPHEDDTSVYAYGLPDHAITAGNYLTGRRKTDQVRIDGSGVTLDVRNWQQIEKHPQRWRSVSDAAISTLSEAQDRGDALLRKAAMGAVSGSIAVPVNCGQQLYDVIEVTDARVGMEAAPKRVLGIATIYNTVRGEYRQKMLLGGV